MDTRCAPARIIVFIRRMSSRSSSLILGLPSGRERKRQNSRNPVRCHEATVSGFTITKAAAQPDHQRRNVIQKSRSMLRSKGRGRFVLKTTSC